MASIKLEWAQFGDFDSFDVLRSDSSIDINALPNPLVTDLKTMSYLDSAITVGSTYYYRVVAWRDGQSKVSSEIQAKALVDSLISLAVVDDHLVDLGKKQTAWSLSSATLIAPSSIEFGSTTGKALTHDAAFFNPNADFKISFDFTVKNFNFGESHIPTNTQDWVYGAFRAISIGGDLMPSIYQRKIFISLYAQTSPIGSTTIQIGRQYSIKIEKTNNYVSVYLNNNLEISYYVSPLFSSLSDLMIIGTYLTVKNFKIHDLTL